MAATINETRACEAMPSIAVAETQVSDASRIARYCTLEELPGLVFGLVTIGYLVMSLLQLVA